MESGFSTLFERYTSIVAFDVETSGLDPFLDQIVEIGAQRIFQKDGELLVEPLHYFVKLYDGHCMDGNAALVNHITESMLGKNGVSIDKAMSDFKRLIEGRTLLVAHNANFDMSFAAVAALKINESEFFQHLDVVDTLTVFKDRAPYPHKLSDAIAHYHLEKYVENNHTALGDALAVLYVVDAMAREKDDLLQYINLIGYNPKYPPRFTLPNIVYCAQPYNSALPLYQKIHRLATCQTQTKPILAGSVPLTDNVIIQEVVAPQTFYRGIEYAQFRKVRNLRFLRNKGMFFANVIGSRIYDTEIKVTSNGAITWYRCSCKAFGTYPKACKHIIALAKVVQQHWMDYFGMSDGGKESLLHQSAVEPNASETIKGSFAPFNADYRENPAMNLESPEAWCLEEKYPAWQLLPDTQAEYISDDEDGYDTCSGPCYECCENELDERDVDESDVENEIPEDYYYDYDREVDTHMDDNFYIGDGDDW